VHDHEQHSRPGDKRDYCQRDMSAPHSTFHVSTATRFVQDARVHIRSSHPSTALRAGAHAVIYGAQRRNVRWAGAVERLRGTKVFRAWATCDVRGEFSSVWREALDVSGLASTRHTIGFGERADETIEAASQLARHWLRSPRTPLAKLPNKIATGPPS
jgi:hypothetical protein